MGTPQSLLTVPNITSMASLQSIAGIMMIIKPSVDAWPLRLVHLGEEGLGGWAVPNVTSMASLQSIAGIMMITKLSVDALCGLYVRYTKVRRGWAIGLYQMSHQWPVYPSDSASSSKWHAWFASRCLDRRLSTWQMTAVLYLTARNAHCGQRTFRLAWCHEHSALR